MPLAIVLLFIFTMAGMTFVPETVLPIMVWPLLLGIGNLALVLTHVIRNRELANEDMAPLLTAVFSFTLAISIAFEHPRRGISFVIALIATFLAGVLWSAWKATKESHLP